VDDLFCPVCNALVAPLGQSEGVFCSHADCPGDRLCQFDVTNVCVENTFCLNFAGERVAVRSQEYAPPPVVVVKKKGKPARPSGPDLFGAVS